jgi:hypothetical protein
MKLLSFIRRSVGGPQGAGVATLFKGWVSNVDNHVDKFAK